MATPSDSATTSKTEAPKSAPSLSPDQLAKFDLDKPKLPDFIADKALQSGNFPYDKNIKGKMYREQLAAPQYELVKLQTHVQNSGARIIALFEGRDSAGKGGCISRILEHLNPPPSRALHRLGQTDPDRIGPMVFSAIHQSPANIR